MIRWHDISSQWPQCRVLKTEFKFNLCFRGSLCGRVSFCLLPSAVPFTFYLLPSTAFKVPLIILRSTPYSNRKCYQRAVWIRPTGPARGAWTYARVYTGAPPVVLTPSRSARSKFPRFEIDDCRPYESQCRGICVGIYMRCGRLARVAEGMDAFSGPNARANHSRVSRG